MIVSPDAPSVGTAAPVACVASVIVPAHNEASVIGRLLDGLCGLPAWIEVIVVCNGCWDDTTSVARDRGAGVRARVLDLPAASKQAALDAGDRTARSDTRLYVDADVRASAESILDVVAALRRGSVLANRPLIRYDTSGADSLVRAFYRARTRTKPLMTSLWGAGFYGVSPEGRARWATFPASVPDDFFVASLFESDEVAIVDTVPVVVSTPRTVSALLHTLRRVYALPTRSPRSSISTLAAVVRSAGYQAP